MCKYTIGVDIGGTSIKFGLFTMDGELLKKWDIPTRKENNGEHILDDVANSIKSQLECENIIPSEVNGIGVGVPGPVTDDGIVIQCANLGWSNLNVSEILKSKTGFQVKAANDANIAALGEVWQGGGKGFQNMIMITLGTGVGGGVIINGKIISGNNGAAGEVGHMKVSRDEEEICGCGRKGCLEQYVSATGIVRLSYRILKQCDDASLLRRNDKITAKDIFDSAKLGDIIALKIVDKFADILGLALSNLACVLDPQVFVIGGGVSKAGNILIDSVKRYYNEYALGATKNAEIKLASLGNDAGIYGGAMLSKENLNN